MKLAPCHWQYLCPHTPETRVLNINGFNRKPHVPLCCKQLAHQLASSQADRDKNQSIVIYFIYMIKFNLMLYRLAGLQILCNLMRLTQLTSVPNFSPTNCITAYCSVSISLKEIISCSREKGKWAVAKCFKFCPFRAIICGLMAFNQ